jgi:tetratricopeptide (TPR) repeat protein
LAGKADEALSLFKEVLSYPPRFYEPEWLEDCLGDAYLQLGRLDDAISEYRRVLTVHSRMAITRYHLAVAYDRKGQTSIARAEYARFLDLWKDADEDVPEIVDAKKRVLGL